MESMLDHVLATFNQLSFPDQEQVAREILLRLQNRPIEPLTDEALNAVADEAFQRLDAEEAQVGQPSAE